MATGFNNFRFLAANGSTIICQSYIRILKNRYYIQAINSENTDKRINQIDDMVKTKAKWKKSIYNAYTKKITYNGIMLYSYNILWLRKTLLTNYFNLNMQYYD